MHRGGGRPSLGLNDSRHGVSAQQQFSFPLLSGKEILGCMADLQIPLGEEALQEPARHREAVRRAFEALVELCTDVTREELSQPAFSGLAALNYPELHEESIPALAFYRAAGKLMDVCGVRDFSIRDVLDPSPKRLRRCLSAAINFCKFREERLVLFTELMEARQATLDGLAAAQDEKARLEAELAALREETAAEVVVIEAETRACDGLAAEIEKLNHAQAALKAESRGVKKTAADRKEALLALARDLEALITEKDRLRGQVVQSPARVRAEMADAAESLERERTEAAAVEKQARWTEARGSALDNAREAVRRCAELLDDVATERAKEDAALQELAQTKASVEANAEKTAEGRVTTSSLSHQLERFEEKLAHLRAHAEAKRTAAEQALADAAAELENARGEKSHTISALQDVEAEARALQQTLEGERRRHAEECAQMVAAYKGLEAAVRKHNDALRSAMSAGGAASLGVGAGADAAATENDAAFLPFKIPGLPAPTPSAFVPRVPPPTGKVDAAHATATVGLSPSPFADVSNVHVNEA